jgi:hypothetical protein
MKNFSKGFSVNIVIIIILAVIVIGGGIYFLNSQSGSEDIGNKTESYFSDKIADMFEKGKPLECSSEVSDVEGSIKAVYYFDNQNKMVRVEMEALNKATGSTTNTVSIIRDNWNYFWDDLMNKDGMKIKFDENEDSILPTENLAVEDSNVNFNFVCKDWKVDPSKFDLPKDKSFKDLSGMMDGLNVSTDNQSDPNNNMPSVSLDNLCEMCNLLPEGSERTECLESCQQN